MVWWTHWSQVYFPQMNIVFSVMISLAASSQNISDKTLTYHYGFLWSSGASYALSLLIYVHTDHKYEREMQIKPVM